MREERKGPGIRRTLSLVSAGSGDREGGPALGGGSARLCLGAHRDDASRRDLDSDPVAKVSPTSGTGDAGAARDCTARELHGDAYLGASPRMNPDGNQTSRRL